MHLPDSERTARNWHRCAAVYRVLVVMQTVGLAASSLVRVIAGAPRVSLAAQPIAVALAVGSVVGVVAGLLMYSLRRAQSHDRDAVIAAWVCLQIAGFLALAGYAVTGTALCFIVGILALVAMHAFSPNRFPL